MNEFDLIFSCVCRKNSSRPSGVTFSSTANSSSGNRTFEAKIQLKVKDRPILCDITSSSSLLSDGFCGKKSKKENVLLVRKGLQKNPLRTINLQKVAIFNCSACRKRAQVCRRGDNKLEPYKSAVRRAKLQMVDLNPSPSSFARTKLNRHI